MVRAISRPPLILALLLSAGAVSAAETVYQAPEAFVAEAFAGAPPPSSVLWLDDALQSTLTGILGHPYPRLRIRYWGRGARTAWVLEEIGKEKPITTGIIVEHGAIVRAKVLVFRESRGWEVKYPFFADQFRGATLNDAGRLDRRIDGISGATLSVRAVTELARVALVLHEHTEFAHDAS